MNNTIFCVYDLKTAVNRLFTSSTSVDIVQYFLLDRVDETNTALDLSARSGGGRRRLSNPSQN